MLLIIGIILIVAGLIILGFAIFGKKPIIDDPVCGGKVDKTDPKAPKVINSKNITELDVSFYIISSYGGDDDYSGFYRIKLKDNVLSEEKLNLSDTVDESFAKKIQAIIDKYDLVRFNGVDVHTAGLPPEYQPFYFTAVYDSGEKLYFSENNNPYEAWAHEVFEAVRESFIELGHSELLPSKEATTIEQFDFAFNVEDKSYKFCPIIMSDDETLLMKASGTIGVDGSGVTEMADISDELYEGLYELITELDLKRIHTGSLASGDDCPHTADGYYEIYVDFENGKQIYGYSSRKEQAEDFRPDAEKLVEFFDAYMQTHNGHIYTW